MWYIWPSTYCTDVRSNLKFVLKNDILYYCTVATVYWCRPGGCTITPIVVAYFEVVVIVS